MVSLRRGEVANLEMQGDGASGWVDYADDGGAAAALEAGVIVQSLAARHCKPLIKIVCLVSLTTVP